MIQINLITKNGDSYKFGSVNQKEIHKDIKQTIVEKDGNEVFNIKLEKGERILVRKRTNTKEGELYIVGYHKKGNQKLFFIDNEGRILDHEKCNCNHTFHGQVQIEEHEQ